MQCNTDPVGMKLLLPFLSSSLAKRSSSSKLVSWYSPAEIPPQKPFGLVPDLVLDLKRPLSRTTTRTIDRFDYTARKYMIDHSD